MAKQLAFYIDTSSCAGCKTCQVACQDKNNLPPEIRWRRVLPYKGGGWVPDPENRDLLIPNNIFSYSVSISCMHCQDPICTEVCPTGASEKLDNGVVVINQNKCIGCRYCQWACPYGARHFNEDTGTMSKCDMCVDYLSQGKNPVCVDACVMRAIKFGELEELRAQYGDIDSICPLPSADITQPSLVITPHKKAQLNGKGTGSVVILPEEV
jgi:anaerobic dimethyl sulfoxide reductase subunit B